jgi:hypothetical protein
MSDVWTTFGNRSKEAVQAANDIAGGLIPLALAAAVGGTLADIAIRASKAKFQSPWAASMVIFAIGWALLKFLPREGVRLIVAGMFGRLGPESYANVIKPLGQKFGVHVELDPHASPGKPPALPGGTDSKDAGKPPAPAAKDSSPAKSGAKPANCARAANDEGWMPPTADIRPIAQGVLENRQNLYDLSGEIFNEMRRRQMVDPTVANETQPDFERLVEDVFTRMAT